MKKRNLFISAVVLIILLTAGYFAYRLYYLPKIRLAEWNEKLPQYISNGRIREGDILFQGIESKQSRAIELATHSRWTHVGIVLKKDHEFVVYEAVQPVKTTPLAKWLARSSGGHYAIKRLKESEVLLTSGNIKQMKLIAEKYIGKDYDIYFEWSDENIYCSELVWKICKQALGVEVGRTRNLKDFDLSSDEVKQVMQKRYGDKIPYEETVISPQDIFISERLISVEEN